jgi:peptidyl-prolyl cis-trans isomerase B (cyclophilin B)
MRRVLGLLLLAAALALPGCGADNPQVVIETSMGTIKAELYVDKAPGTVKNFLKYVADKHYDGTIFHRVIPTFMIQGGGMTPENKPKGGQYPPIKNESYNGLSNKRGSLAMARTNEANSATDQFFINVKDNTFLDRAKAQDSVGYCVFGQVTDGMDVVDKIRNVPTGPGDVPEQVVLIKSIRIQP